MKHISLEELNPLTPKQLQARDLMSEDDAGQILLSGGSRSGKTTIICRTLVLRCILSPGSTHAIFREHFNHLKASIISQTMPDVLRLWFPYLETKLNKSDWYLSIFVGGKESRIYYGGLDDKTRTEKILGQEHSSIYLNECSTISFSAYQMAITRLAQKSGLKLRVYLDCNPPLESHWLYKIFIKKQDPSTGEPLRRTNIYKYLRINPLDNQANIPQEYLEFLKDQPKSYQDRFFHGKFGSSVPNALWPDGLIKSIARPQTESEWIAFMSQIQRAVVAVDPSGCGQDVECANDQIGIVVCGLRQDGKAVVIDDQTGYYSPANWGKMVGQLYDKYGCDLALGESNFGGAMVEEVITSSYPNINYKEVKVTKGKHLRAEPIAGYYEQDKVLHVGNFIDIETEMSQFSTAGYLGEFSPNRVDGLVMGLHELLGKPKYNIGVF